MHIGKSLINPYEISIINLIHLFYCVYAYRFFIILLYAKQVFFSMNKFGRIFIDLLLVHISLHLY